MWCVDVYEELVMTEQRACVVCRCVRGVGYDRGLVWCVDVCEELDMTRACVVCRCA